MRFFVACLALSFATLSTGCVRGYHAINYESADFVRTESDDGLEFAYLYDAQPGYYGGKATKRGFSVIAVRVVNTTSEPVELNRNTLQVMYNGESVTPARGPMVANAVKQPVLDKLFWGLLNFTVYDGRGEVTAFIPSGPFIAGGTMLGASSNNRKVRRDYTEQNVFALTVPANESAEGILILQETGRAPISFDYVAPQN